MALTKTQSHTHPSYLRLLRSPPSAGRLRDADNRPLPSHPRSGMIFEVCWGPEIDAFDTWRVCRVNTRSFYIQTWSHPPERRPLREWDDWLREMMLEGDLRLLEDSPPPTLRCISGGLDAPPPPLSLLD